MPSADAQQWDVVTDVVVVGSGGGSMCAALAVAEAGRQALIIEKAEKIGGSTAMSGGVLWLPDNQVSRAAGVHDSRDDALAYFEAVVGPGIPSASPERVKAYLDGVEPMISFLQSKGVPFRHCEGYADYYDDRPGGKPRGRSLETELFDTRRLGVWEERLRISDTLPAIPVHTSEVASLTAGLRAPAIVRTSAKVAARLAKALVRRQSVRGSGVALQGWMLLAALRADVPIWTSTPVTELLTEAGSVVGVRVVRGGREIRVRARDGVLLNSGGFSHNRAMREKFGRQPASVEWTSANPGDTGEVIQAAMRLGASTALMDEAWWIPSSVMPDGAPLYAVYERAKPHAIMVDGAGRRYVNEASSYMEVGQAMYERNASVPAIPSWWIMDSRNRRRYMWGLVPGGYTPSRWTKSNYMVKADSLEDLAARCGIDRAGLEATVAEFNDHAREGKDPEFGKGERAYDRYYGDPRVRPNPCVGPVDRPPFYAVALYPGDVGTCGGLVTDEHARVLATDGRPIEGLYATGNCTASVMGRHYPGAGASIGASFVFGWIAAHHTVTAKARADGAVPTNAGGAP